MSVTEVHYKKDKKTMEISHRIFADDLEKALSKKYNKKFDLSQPEQTDVNIYINKYLDETFRVSSSDMFFKSEFVGKELDKDAILVYMEIDSLPNLKSIRFSDKILFDILPDQSNLVHFHNGKNVESKKVNARNPNCGFEF